MRLPLLLLIAGLFCALAAIVLAEGWLDTTANPTNALAWLAAAVAFNIGSKIAST